jgi:hypothetical protein
MAKKKLKQKVEKFKYTGYVARLDEYEDDDISLFPEPRHNNRYTYEDSRSAVVSIISLIDNHLGKKVTIQVTVHKEGKGCLR